MFNILICSFSKMFSSYLYAYHFYNHNQPTAFQEHCKKDYKLHQIKLKQAICFHLFSTGFIFFITSGKSSSSSHLISHDGCLRIPLTRFTQYYISRPIYQQHWNTDNGLSEIVGQMEAKNVQIHHGAFGACVTLTVKTMSDCYYIGYLLHINNVGFYQPY